mmetsp:Transcript_12908/g.31396  ORF Transcript_12908/g.31396 Transcript_12908/m.31396 type:complete len:107 (-) Transcript_12908:7-327(-)
MEVLSQFVRSSRRFQCLSCSYSSLPKVQYINAITQSNHFRITFVSIMFFLLPSSNEPALFTCIVPHVTALYFTVRCCPTLPQTNQSFLFFLSSCFLIIHGMSSSST